MIAILHAYGHLDLNPDTELSQEENSKKQDANIVNIDFSSSFNLPYSPENIQAYDRYGFEKFRCQLYSDGFLIGEYTAKFRENTFNHNDKKGNLTIQLGVLYDSLREDMDNMKLPDALDGIFWTINPSGVSPATDETKIHKWLSQEQTTPSGSYPFRFPEYGLVDKYEGSFPVPDYEADTLSSDDKQGFKNWVPVNHFNNQQKELPSRAPFTLGTTPVFPDKIVKYNVLYDRLSYNMKFFDTQDDAPIATAVTQAGTGFSHFYRNDPQPRRIWGLACPCFPYLWVMEKALEKMGYRLVIEWDNSDHKQLFENLLVLNNYNIFDIVINRIEGYARYWESIPFGGGTISQEDISMRTYWVGDDNPIFIAGSKPTAVLEYSTYDVIAKNHVPDISVADIVDDFIAKTNMEIVIDGSSFIFRKPLIVQDENKRAFDPEIKIQAFEWKMKKKLIYKYDDEREDNIPDYIVVEDGDQEENIESPIVPVYLHYKSRPAGNDGYFPFIVGSPAINKDLNQVNLEIYESHIFYKASVLASPLTWIPALAPSYLIDKEVKAEYDVTACPKFCGVLIPFSALPNVGLYYFHETYLMETIAAPYHLNGRTLKWQDATGIFEINYKSYLAIFKAKLIHLFREKYSPETFQNFSHYKFFNLLGRKVFGMKRKYTLPLSRNPMIEYEGYEAE